MNRLIQQQPTSTPYRLIAILAVLILTACAPAIQPTPPPVELPAQFSTTGETSSDQHWWASFNDPELNKLVDLALTDNLNLRATWQRLKQADAAARKTGADKWPTLSAEGSANRTESDTTDTSTFTLGLTTAYEIDLWGRVAANRTAAELDLQASAADLQTAALTLTAQLATTWYQLIEERGKLRLFEAQLDANRQIGELVRVQVTTGKTGVADLLQQQQLYESVEGDMKLVVARIKEYEHQLAILCGRTPDQSVAAAIAKLPALPPLPATGLPLELIQRRPDLRAAQAEVQAADQRLSAAIADRFPRLSLSGRLSGTDSSVSDLFDNWLASLTANLVGPLIDGGKRRAEVDRTDAAARAALNSYGQSVLTALGEVEDALSREQNQQEYVASLDRQLDYSTKVLNNLRDRYTRGATDYQRVLSALVTRQQLERNRLQSQSDLLLNRVVLYRALSGGWSLTISTDDPDHPTARKVD